MAGTTQSPRSLCCVQLCTYVRAARTGHCPSRRRAHTYTWWAEELSYDGRARKKVNLAQRPPAAPRLAIYPTAFLFSLSFSLLLSRASQLSTRSPAIGTPIIPETRRSLGILQLGSQAAACASAVPTTGGSSPPCCFSPSIFGGGGAGGIELLALNGDDGNGSGESSLADPFLNSDLSMVSTDGVQ